MLNIELLMLVLILTIFMFRSYDSEKGLKRLVFYCCRLVIMIAVRVFECRLNFKLVHFIVHS